jgi:Spy/CpxP family protein refolding chaperone
MKRSFFIVVAIVMVVAAGLAISALAQGHRRFGPDGWMLRHMTRKLNLTEAQQGKIKGILQTERVKIQPLMQQLRQNEQADNAAVSGTFDEAQARTFAGKQTQIMADLIVEKERTKSEIYAVLTPDQRTKALQLMQEREQRWQQHRQKHSQPQTQASPSR